MPHRWVLCVAIALVPAAVRAQDSSPDAGVAEDWSLHAQATAIGQGHFGFPSPYQGPNSLRDEDELRETVTGTLFLGRRLWSGAELYVNPEVTQGTGLSGTLGVAGFPNGEATRATGIVPEINVARLFLRQTIDLGGAREPVAADANQLAGERPTSRLVLTIGKLAAVDLFDDNLYSHDPRTQFMNWSLMDDGAWDYPADAKGYTNGVSVELDQPGWAMRWGGFMQPRTANGENIEWNVGRAWGQVVELERRYAVWGRAGTVRVLGFLNREHAGSYHAALEQALTPPDVTQTRTEREKYGFGLNIEQALTDAIGLFVRAGWNNGLSESWAFTEIDRTLALGFSVGGKTWGRPEDSLGVAAVVNGISAPHRRYLAAGGSGFILGDGRLRYGPETIVESYYQFKLRWVWLALDYQLVVHPAYNRDRGPVSVLAARLHWER